MSFYTEEVKFAIFITCILLLFVALIILGITNATNTTQFNIIGSKDITTYAMLIVGVIGAFITSICLHGVYKNYTDVKSRNLSVV